MDVTIRLLGPADAAVLARVDDDVFDGPLDPRWTAEFLADERHHLAVALVDGAVVGMASALHYVHPDKAPELWVNEVGVADGYQGQGIGRRLLAALFAHGLTLGCQEAWVATEFDNAAARRLYAAAGGIEESIDTVYVTFQLAAEPPA